jgi:lysophospholipase L1-like esterase
MSLRRRAISCGFVLALSAGVGAGTARATPSLNLDIATADTKAKIAQGGQANIVLLGDSLAFDPVNSFRPYFTQHLQQFYGDAGPGYVGAYSVTSGYGSDWSHGVLGGSDPAPHLGLDGLWAIAPASATPPTAGTITSFYDKIELQYLAQPGGGKLNLSLPGSGTPVTTLDTNSSAREVRSFSYDFPDGVATSLAAQPDGSGPVALLGLNLVNDTPGVRVHRAGNGGWGVNQFLQRDPSFDQQLQALKTDMVMVALGANDGATPHDEYVTKLNQLVDRVQAAVPAAEIVMVTPYDYGTAAAPVVADAIDDVAAARGLGLINLYETAGSYQFFQSHGYLGDVIHFSPAGGEYVGNFLFDAFRTNGASLPEPASMLAIGAGMVALLARPAGRTRRAAHAG